MLELAPRVMARAVTAEISDIFRRGIARPASAFTSVCRQPHRGEGGKVTGVSLSDGRHLPADLVVVGVGVLPNIELAAEAGLAVAAGIIVDEYLSTSDPASPRSATARCSPVRASADRSG